MGHMTSDDTAQTAPEQTAAAPAAAEETEHRQSPRSEAFKAFLAEGWAEHPAPQVQPLPATAHTPARRGAVAAAFPGERLVVPAGELRVRSNDCDYRFRPHSAFAHLTGLGTDREPDTALVLEPVGDGTADARYYMRPSATRESEDFYADARYGELWIGPRPTPAQVGAETGLAVHHLDRLVEDVTAGLGDGTVVRIVRGADSGLDAALDAARTAAGLDLEKCHALDADLARVLSELRLVKDAYEIGQLQLAVDVTARGFEDVVRDLPSAIGHVRGERVVERAFEGRARVDGNGVGYDTIAAAGHHACTLHWITNDGPVRDGDLLLLDAGVEVESLYTADVTRTLPVNGRFTDAQREVYDVVLEAADAAFAVVRPGARFRDVHAAAMEVIARRVHAWGLLPGTVEESLADEGQFHRRWLVHGTSHHLGLDVHDCAQARRSMYLDAELLPGMVFTIEPGLYFFPDDLKAPERFRGIGVRIEDDVLVTEDGYVNLSGMLPRTAADVEAWMARVQAR